MARTKTLVIRPSRENGYDTTIMNNYADRDYGWSDSLFAGYTTGGDLWRGLIKFDISQIPAGATITKATLRLYCSLTYDNNSYNISLHRSLVEWFASVYNNTVPVDVDSSVWNYRIYNTHAWAGGAGGASGTEYAALATDTVSVDKKPNVFYNWDVTSDIVAFHNGTYNNYGWWLISSNESTAGSVRRFLSAESEYVGLRPRLVIEYTESNTAGWYDDDWGHRKEITVDSTFVDADLTDFPLLVDLSGDLDVSAEARADFADVLFTASDGETQLQHELVGPQHKIIDLDGAWTFYGSPNAVYYSGTYQKTYVGWVNKSGDVKIASYNHSTEAWSSPTTLHSALDVNDHATPSILIRDDGYVMVFYCAHNGTEMYMRISSSAEDISSFAAAVGLDASIGANYYNYPTPIQLTGEIDSPIYLIFSEGTSLSPPRRKVSYSKSTDSGSTWSAKTAIFDNTDINYYHACQNGNNRIDFAISDSHPNLSTSGILIHLYYQGGNYYKTDGTQIAAALPLASADCTTVHSNDGTRSWVWDIAIDTSGNPAIAYVNYPSGHLYDHRYRYAKWNGTTWSTTEIAEAGRPISVTWEEYSSGLTIDPNDVNTVYASVSRQGVPNIVTFTTADGGATWTEGRHLTGSASIMQFRPRAVWNGDSALPLVWLQGIYTVYMDYDTSVMCGLPGSPAKFWVKVPTITSATDTTIYAYYGNSISKPQGVEELVWESVYKLVWHGWRNHVTVSQAASPPIQSAINLPISNTTGSIYEELSGLYDHILNFGSYPNMQAWAEITVELLVNHDSTGSGTDSPLSNWSASGAGVLARIGATTDSLAGYLRTAAGQIGGAFTGTVAADTVKRLAFRYASANGFEAFIDKVLDATVYGVGSGTLADVASATVLTGASENGSNDLKGSMEEIRIANSRRSTAWLDFVYDNIYDTTLTLGTDETGGTGGTTSISLTWVDNSENEDGFSLERSIDGGAWSEIATPAANAVSYTDSGVNNGHTYDYRIKATSTEKGDSEWSNIASVTV
jgi:hypothetical protein